MGTASAKPAKLQAFVEAAEEIRGELESRIRELRASYDRFQQSGGDYGVANPDLMDGELPGFINNYITDETFVATVAQAFIDADPDYAGSGLASVDSVTFDAAFRAAAVRAGINPDLLLADRDEVTVDDPVAAGIPRTSGFVADPVCTATGHFLEAEDDFTWPDRLALLRWRRTYSSRFVAGGPFGRGWASWATVMCLPQDDGSVAYNGPDGQMAVIPVTGQDGTGPAYARVAGLLAELSHDDEGAGWRLTWDWHSDHPGEVWTFDAGAGRLQTVTGPTVGTTTFLYEAGLLVAVVHQGGRRLDLDWDGARIVAVRSSCGREARYHYDDAGDLVRTERVLGDRRYVPDEQGRVVEVWDADGVRLCHNTYDGEGRVLLQVSPFGRETVFRYEAGNRTVVSDTGDGPVSVYEHDAAGRLVGLTDHHGHRMRRSFDSEGRCVAATGFDDGASVQTYADDGRSATRQGADGISERWDYDDQRRVVRHEVEGGPVLDFAYDGDDVLPTRVTSPDGWAMDFEVGDGLVRSMTDADGVTIRFDHDDDGNVVATTNGLGAVTSVDPHVSGEALRRTMPDGAVYECDRDDAGRLLVLRNPVGDELRLEWSPAGRLTALVEANGARTTFEHGEHGTLARIVDALGAAVEMHHDELERLVGVSAPGGAKWSFSYSALGLLSLVHDPAGGAWAYDYDAEGRMIAAVDPLGHEVVQRRDPAGHLTELVDRSGNVTRYTRDALGRVVSKTDPEGAVTTCAWDVWGRPTRTETPDGASLSYAYTPAGRVREVRTAGGRSWTVEHDAVGRLVAVTDAAGATTRYEWDACDRVVATIAPSGRRDTVTYDGLGRVVATEGGGRVWRIAYDHAGRPTAVTNPLGATTTYRYDLRGKLAAATDPLGNAVRVTYDERGNPTTVIDPLDGYVTTAYDAMKRPVAMTDQLGRVTRLERDATGRVSRQELPTGDVVEWARDARGLVSGVRVNGRDAVVVDRDLVGRRVLIHEPARNRTFTLGWSPGGRLRTLDVDGRTLRWEHDRDGSLAARQDPTGATTRYRRDTSGRLTALESDRWGSVVLDRDPDGSLTALRAAGLERRWDRDAAGLVVGYREVADGDEHATTLVRDGAARVVEVHDDRGVTRHRYDDAGQLVAAAGPDGAWTWHYDPAGRLAAEDGPGGRRTFHYDDAHQLVRIDGSDGTTHLGYDAAGRRTSEDGPAGTRRYTWDGLGRLSGIESGGRRRDVDVDALGQLAEFDGTPLTWDGNAAVPELLAIGDRSVAGIPGMPLGLADPSGETAWLSGGWRGTATGGRDPWGAPVDRAATADGAPAAGGPSLGFLGELELDGLVWLRNRTYDPATRGFLSPDLLPGIPGLPVALNPYHYAGNDPIGFADPLGLEPLSIDAYNEIREQETSVQWTNIAMVGLSAASLFVPGGPLVAMAIGAGLGMAPGIIQGATTGNWDVGAILVDGAVGAVAGRVGLTFGGRGTSLMQTMGRGVQGGAYSAAVPEVADVLPLPGSDGQFNIENVVIGGAAGGAAGAPAWGMAMRGQPRLSMDDVVPSPAALPPAPTRPAIEAPPTRLAIEPPPTRLAIEAGPTRPAIEAAPTPAAIEPSPTRLAIEASPSRPALEAAPTRPALEAAPSHPAIEASPTPAAIEASPSRPALEAAPSRPAIEPPPTRLMLTAGAA